MPTTTHDALSAGTKIQLGLVLTLLGGFVSFFLWAFAVRTEALDQVAKLVHQVEANRVAAERQAEANRIAAERSGERLAAGQDRTNEALQRTNEELQRISGSLHRLDDSAASVELLVWVLTRLAEENPEIKVTFPPGYGR